MKTKIEKLQLHRTASKSKVIMPESLNTFLLTAKYKKIACLRHICDTLELETEGTADVMRKRILTHVDGKEEKDSVVRKIAIDFNNEEMTNHPRMEDGLKAKTRSDSKSTDETINLFSQEDRESMGNSYRSSVTENEVESDDDESETGTLTKGCDDNIQNSGQSPANLLSSKVKTWINSSCLVDNEKDCETKSTDLEACDDFFNEIEKSFRDLTVHDGTNEKEHAHVIEVNVEKEDTYVKNVEGETTPSPCCSFGFIVSKSKEFIASKDAQIDTMEQHLRIKETQLSRMEDMHRALVKKMDDLITIHGKTVDTILINVNELKSQNQDQVKEIDSLKQKLSENISKMNQMNELLASKASEQENQSKWNDNCQNLMLKMAEKIEKNTTLNRSDVNIHHRPQSHGRSRVDSYRHPQLHGRSGVDSYPHPQSDAPDVEKKEEIMIITDSNGKHLNPRLLHHEKKVTVEQRFTLDATVSKIPSRDDPDLVTDIVFMTGLNDSRKTENSVEDVVKKQKEVCNKYCHRFKKARFHLANVAPIDFKQKNLNHQLKNYSRSAGISFIENNGIFDRVSGDVRPGMLDGIHYTPVATKILAKELKRSLYSNEPLRTSKTHVTQSYTKSASEKSLMAAMESFLTKADRVLDSLGN